MQSWGITARVIVMARQQTQSAKDNDSGCLVGRVGLGKGRWLTRQVIYLDGGAF